ncbi:uncharacterized protein K452DRAFT_54530 [Aplosporella prunicola CBS 121167]|uniref:Uncharacterized protein n=1 Tax=Aplosporella prunicola CBS 121167 TaxID=1176127 RepID=A0A6A6B9V2_9PEZI|nr:uncharacterized protein K452DRAFT_54530 [Aplosporella prunicola CBS 121167]KAF2140348.1 hypothetical protein K452DRAFT_54530 [Aplosporella prunicola CBS 121167]
MLPPTRLAFGRGCRHRPLIPLPSARRQLSSFPTLPFQITAFPLVPVSALLILRLTLRARSGMWSTTPGRIVNWALYGAMTISIRRAGKEIPWVQNTAPYPVVGQWLLLRRCCTCFRVRRRRTITKPGAR